MADFQSGTPGMLQSIPTTAAHLGQGVSYPVDVDTSGRLRMSAGTVLVAEAVTAIAVTVPGERVMQPDLGGDVLAFEPVPMRGVDRLVGSILGHEARVKRVEVDVLDPDELGRVSVNLTYTVNGVATPQTLTVPWFAGPEATFPTG